MTPHIASSTVVTEGRFLVCKRLEYIDANGETRTWEAVDRRRTVPGSCPSNAALIVAKIVPDDEIVLIRQFRPPAGKMMIEFPAGLIDPGETPAATAVRELYEETGFEGKVLTVSADGYSSPGMTGESIVLVSMEIDGSKYPGGMIPENHQEASENIEVFRVKSSELAHFIAEMESAGCGVDSKIHTVLAFRRMGL
ncbi:MAG: NUDIX hydrolase [Lentisphaeria bacterium]|nr:NUDIX hydrolase [Lentisphaeria bacterium]